jgi:hypothetical protein
VGEDDEVRALSSARAKSLQRRSVIMVAAAGGSSTSMHSKFCSRTTIEKNIERASSTIRRKKKEGSELGKN